jgi:hypothetical protein
MNVTQKGGERRECDLTQRVARVAVTTAFQRRRKMRTGDVNLHCFVFFTFIVQRAKQKQNVSAWVRVRIKGAEKEASVEVKVQQ